MAPRVGPSKIDALPLITRVTGIREPAQILLPIVFVQIDIGFGIFRMDDFLIIRPLKPSWFQDTVQHGWCRHRRGVAWHTIFIPSSEVDVDAEDDEEEEEEEESDFFGSLRVTAAVAELAAFASLFSFADTFPEESEELDEDAADGSPEKELFIASVRTTSWRGNILGRDNRTGS
jgi:hypothetical protein